jgi:hypothetical protein
MAKRFASVAMLLAMLLALGFISSTASAGLDACRADPLIVLSDGSRISVSVRINTSAEDIQQVEYVLHVPRGLSIQKIVYTGGALRDKERVTLIADNPPGVFITETTVTAEVVNARVSVWMRLSGGVSSTVSGFVNERLLIQLTQ